MTKTGKKSSKESTKSTKTSSKKTSSDDTFRREMQAMMRMQTKGIEFIDDDINQIKKKSQFTINFFIPSHPGHSARIFR